MGKKRGIVMDGRDIATTVFPDAEVKVFMTADTVIRASRRQKELFAKDDIVDLDIILENIKKRDNIDSTREESPLRMDKEAFLLDTTFMTVDEQVDIVLQLATSKMIAISREVGEVQS